MAKKREVAKKAKKGVLSIVFSRTALIIILLALQLAVMFAIPFLLWDSAVPVYGAMTVLQVIVTIYIINEKSSTEFTLTWILLVLVSPVFGTLFYLYVRMEIGHRYLRNRLNQTTEETWPYMRQPKYVMDALRVSKPANANLAEYMNRQTHMPVYRNTKAVYFSCGEKKFPAMIEQLKKAEKFIFMEYFIVDEGRMWDTILEILKEKAAQGVEVRFMYDGMNSISRLPYNYPKILQRYGIKCKVFSPLRPILSTTQNNRDHRKICVIDGKVGFTGGINLADEYINEKERFGYWKDTAVMIEGDAVQSLTMLFLQMWNATESKPTVFENYLTEMSGELHRELGFTLPYGDSPYDNENVGEEVYCHILNHAKKYVHIMTPYLILDREMMDALCRAAKSGIDVKIIMPHIPDKWYAFALAKTYYEELITAGVKIYEFKPGFVHAKVFSSDDDTATVGTINLDFRSLYLHFECGIFFYNNLVVRDVERDFQETLKQCQHITMADVNKTSLFTMLCGRILRLIAPLM